MSLRVSCRQPSTANATVSCAAAPCVRRSRARSGRAGTAQRARRQDAGTRGACARTVRNADPGTPLPDLRKLRIDPWINLACIAFEHLLPVGGRERRRVLDIALGVVEPEAGFRIIALHGADHFGCE